MDKVAETSVVIERKVEESVEVSEPKTISPETRKRPASEVDRMFAPDANCDGASEPKRCQVQGCCKKAIAEFDEARCGVKKE